jgi:trimethylamine--corrinoid protein Co-methyltransferase
MSAGAQLARRYNLPYRGSGSLNTSKVPDAQAAWETMWNSWPAILSHTNFIMHATGWLEGGLTACFEKVVMDMENLAMFQRYLAGVEISDETLALEMMRAVGPGGHHFGTPHTQARYSTEFYQPVLADRQDAEGWQINGAEDAATRANKIYKQILADYQRPPLDAAICEHLADFVERRQHELKGVELYT